MIAIIWLVIALLVWNFIVEHAEFFIGLLIFFVITGPIAHEKLTPILGEKAVYLEIFFVSLFIIGSFLPKKQNEESDIVTETGKNILYYDPEPYRPRMSQMLYNEYLDALKNNIKNAEKKYEKGLINESELEYQKEEFKRNWRNNVF